MKIVKLMTCDSAAVIVSLLSGCRKQPDNRETGMIACKKMRKYCLFPIVLILTLIPCVLPAQGNIT